ncbi:hypothetical protein GCM10007205_23860 [Oxalicibacterium flavum]|uniref:Gamma-butyrobetaine hydroxylase-like N-terminal domain-containing protein n=1 Tax=Oxalicibacterium flavum TaxID=179467 RepID=A0A8J2XYJ0_9BURK|nr:DUF971 domain-containing protein [Oxalicibacterium flavum]GGC14206.1 hypothetical protein GCM10007205_23860 [Oxalicibacterium flavum]
MSSSAVCDETDVQEVPYPYALELDPRACRLEMKWPDLQAAVPYKVLRQSCRCSVCESVRRALDDVPPVDAGVTLLKIELLGSMGVQLFFSDGHERGIYPWTYLRRIADGRAAEGVDDFPQALMKGWKDE